MPRKLLGRTVTVFAAALSLVAISIVPAVPASATGATVSVACVNDPPTDTAALQSAIQSAGTDNGVVSIAAGTCALDDHLPVPNAETINGAGQGHTFIVQHARLNILDITGDGVTVKNVNLDTGTYNTTEPPVLKDPDPGVLFSNANNTTVKNVTGKAGSGYGMRLVGPQPCSSDQRSGQVVNFVTMTTVGTGGFAAIDVSCQNGASVTNVTIDGGILAVYQDQNVNVQYEKFDPGPYAKTCAEPWIVTGPASTITIDSVTSAGGYGRVNTGAGPVTGLTVTNQTVTNPACQ